MNLYFFSNILKLIEKYIHLSEGEFKTFFKHILKKGTLGLWAIRFFGNLKKLHTLDELFDFFQNQITYKKY